MKEILVLAWGWSGILLHHYTFAKRFKIYDAWGYILSTVPGPVVFLITKELDAIDEGKAKFALIYQILQIISFLMIVAGVSVLWD